VNDSPANGRLGPEWADSAAQLRRACPELVEGTCPEPVEGARPEPVEGPVL